MVQQVYQMPFYHLPQYTSTSLSGRVSLALHPSILESVLHPGWGGSRPEPPTSLHHMRPLFASLLLEPLVLDSRASSLLDSYPVLPKDILPKKEYMGGIFESLCAWRCFNFAMTLDDTWFNMEFEAGSNFSVFCWTCYNCFHFFIL